MTPRKRRRDRRAAQYPATGSALGNPTNAERLSVGVAEVAVGKLTDRERIICIELAHFFAGAIADLEADNAVLNDKLLEIVRLNG